MPQVGNTFHFDHTIASRLKRLGGHFFPAVADIFEVPPLYFHA